MEHSLNPDNKSQYAERCNKIINVCSKKNWSKKAPYLDNSLDVVHDHGGFHRHT